MVFVRGWFVFLGSEDYILVFYFEYLFFLVFIVSYFMEW